MSNAVTGSEVDDLTSSITEEIRVKATLEATFEALLEELGRGMTGAEDKPMPMIIEAWPGVGGFATWPTGTGISGSTCRRSSGRRCLNSTGP